MKYRTLNTKIRYKYLDARESEEWGYSDHVWPSTHITGLNQENTTRCAVCATYPNTKRRDEEDNQERKKPSTLTHEKRLPGRGCNLGRTKRFTVCAGWRTSQLLAKPAEHMLARGEEKRNHCRTQDREKRYQGDRTIPLRLMKNGKPFGHNSFRTSKKNYFLVCFVLCMQVVNQTKHSIKAEPCTMSQTVAYRWTRSIVFLVNQISSWTGVMFLFPPCISASIARSLWETHQLSLGRM